MNLSRIASTFTFISHVNSLSFSGSEADYMNGLITFIHLRTKKISELKTSLELEEAKSQGIFYKMYKPIENNNVTQSFASGNSYYAHNHNDLNEAFKFIEKERDCCLREALRTLLLSKVIPECSTNMSLDNVLMIPDETVDAIIGDMINLGEQEPYGVNGGTIVVHFGNSEKDLAELSKKENNNFQEIVGKFKVNPNTITTFQLHLTLIPSTNMKHKMMNLMRRFQAKTPIMVADQKFKLSKHCLYCCSECC